jgi:cation-transporting ATPase 13A3/4/5
VNGKLIGDPIDVKMFEGVNWVLRENVENKQNFDALISTFVRPGMEEDLDTKINRLENDDEIDKVIAGHYEIGIVKRFDFSSKLQRMSVLTKKCK